MVTPMRAHVSRPDLRNGSVGLSSLRPGVATNIGSFSHGSDYYALFLVDENGHLAEHYIWPSVGVNDWTWRHIGTPSEATYFVSTPAVLYFPETDEYQGVWMIDGSGDLWEYYREPFKSLEDGSRGRWRRHGRPGQSYDGRPNRSALAGNPFALGVKRKGEDRIYRGIFTVTWAGELFEYADFGERFEWRAHGSPSDEIVVGDPEAVDFGERASVFVRASDEDVWERTYAAYYGSSHESEWRRHRLPASPMRYGATLAVDSKGRLMEWELPEGRWDNSLPDPPAPLVSTPACCELGKYTGRFAIGDNGRLLELATREGIHKWRDRQTPAGIPIVSAPVALHPLNAKLGQAPVYVFGIGRDGQLWQIHTDNAEGDGAWSAWVSHGGIPA